MATIPTMHTFATGEVATASNINNNTVSAFAFLSAVPLFKGRQTVAQNLNGQTFTALLLDTEDVDTDNGHSTVSNTSRYVSQTAGWYELAGAWQLIATAVAGRRISDWRVNGTEIPGGQTCVIGSAQSTAGLPGTQTYFLNVGDYVELYAYQDNTSSGTNTATGSAGSGSQCWMTARWLHT